MVSSFLLVSSAFTCSGTLGSTGCECGDENNEFLPYSHCTIIQANGTFITSGTLVSTDYTYLCQNGTGNALIYSKPCSCIPPIKDLNQCKPFVPTKMGEKNSGIQTVTAFYDGKIPNIMILGISYTDTMNITGTCGNIKEATSNYSFNSPNGNVIAWFKWSFERDSGQITGLTSCWNTE